MESLGDRAKGLREQKGLAQNEAAEQMTTMFGAIITPGMLSLWENNKVMPSIENLRRLAEFYKTTMDYIATGELSQGEALYSKDMSMLLKRLKDDPSFREFVKYLLDYTQEDLLKLAKVMKALR